MVRVLLLLPLLVVSGLRAAPVEPPVSFTDSLTTAYVNRNVPALRQMLGRARTLGDNLLVRYRLYPLTEDASLLRDLPDADDVQTARDLAVLSALWAFRVNDAPALRKPTYGRRAQSILERAQRLAPNDPYVLLVDGQSLLYKPRLFGGDQRRALERFRTLRTHVEGRPDCGVPTWEADVWIWLTLRKLNDPEARAFRDRLLAHNPPPLFRAFLQNPPD